MGVSLAKIKMHLGLMFVKYLYTLSTSNVTRVALGSVDSGSFLKKSVVSLMLLFTRFENDCKTMYLTRTNLFDLPNLHYENLLMQNTDIFSAAKLKILFETI